MATIKTLAIITILTTVSSVTMPSNAATLLSGYVQQDEQAEANQVPVSASATDSFEGIWQCQTEVVDSNIDSVEVGQMILSQVQFSRTNDGQIRARFDQPGWTETQSSTISSGTNEMTTDRTSYYFGQGSKGAWATRCHDQFIKVDRQAIASQSYVDQYIDGQYLGRYRTRSVLHRLSPARNIAQLPSN